MLHDLFGGKPLLGKNIRSVLAHADAVAVARDVEGEGTVLVCHSERGRAQRENGAQIVSAQLDAADRDGGDIVRVVSHDVADPPIWIAGEISVRLCGKEERLEFRRRKGRNGVVVRHELFRFGA